VRPLFNRGGGDGRGNYFRIGATNNGADGDDDNVEKEMAACSGDTRIGQVGKAFDQ
jgi:hypothetical protein